MADTPSLERQFAVHLDGKKLEGEEAAAILAIRVGQTLHGASSFELVVSDDDLKWQDAPTFTECKEVKIELGAPGKLKTVFDGEVTAWRTELERSGPTVLVVRGLDRSHRMMRAHKTRTYASASPLDCAQKIASEYGFTARLRGGSPAPVKTYRFQANQTDFDFLRGMAELEGYLFWLDGKDLHFERPQLSDQDDCAFSFGADLKTFLPTANFRRPAVSVEVGAWDASGKAEISASARPGDELWTVPGGKPGAKQAKFTSTKTELSVVESQVSTHDHADTVARAALTRRAMEFITAEVEVQGNPAVKPGAMVNLKKVGPYSGHYLVTEANHFYDAAGYNCIFYVARDKWGDSSNDKEQQQAAKKQPATQPAQPAPAKQVAPTEFVLQVLDDLTGKPLAHVRLEVKLANGKSRSVQTDADGLIQVREAGAGNNEVSSALEDATLDHTLVFVATGEGTAGRKGKADLPPLATPALIAKVEEHKVESGDTLEKLAAKCGLSWQALAKFNWGVEERDRFEGCELVYLPGAWSASGLASGKPHFVRARRIAGRLPDLKLLYQIDPHAPAAKNDLLVLESEDGSWRHELKVSGLSEVEPHWVEAVFPSPPAGVRFNLLQDPGDGNPPLYVFKGVTYAELG